MYRFTVSDMDTSFSKG